MTVSSPWRSGCALVLGLLAGLGAARAQEQPSIERPAASRRIVAQFDFDKPEPFALPRYWDLAQDGSKASGPRPGFPVYNGAEHDTAVFYRGAGSVRLFTRGGSTSLRLNSGVVPVFDGTEYLVSAKVRTHGLRQGRAAVVARYLDKSGLAVAGTQARSELVATAAEQWQLVSVPLRGSDAAAAYIQIDLEILQPDQFQKPELGAHQLWPNDFPAEAWFDDVTVVQLPRVTMATDSPTNLITSAEPPRVKVSIRDLTGEPVSGRLTVQDAAGRVVDEQARPAEAGFVSWEWKPNLTRRGWYRASMELSTRDRRVGGTYVDFVWLPAASSGVEGSPGNSRLDRGRFGVMLDELPPGAEKLLPGILGQIGSGGVSIPVWSAEQTTESVQSRALDLIALVSELKIGWQEVTFELPRMPRELADAAKLEPDNLSGLFAQDDKVWLPYLLPLIDKYGQTVRRWQVGRMGVAEDPADSGTTGFAPLERLLSRMVPGPVVAVPWPAERAATVTPGSGVGELLVSLPYSVPSEAISLLGAAWSESMGANPPALTLALEPLPGDRFSREESAANLVKKLVEFWAAFCSGGSGFGDAAAVTLTQPWEWPTRDQNQIMPRAELAAYANAIPRLAGRRVVGKLPAARGVTCYILASAPGTKGGAGSGRTGALVAWANEPDAEAALEIFLGDGDVRAVDIWGNACEVVRSGGSARPGAPASPIVHRVPLSAEPVFVENVDVDLSRFIASFRLEPDFVAARTGEHEVTMVLSNPFAMRAQGRIAVLEPGGLTGDPANRDRSWRISPRSSAFTLGPGETARIPITVSFSAAEEAGPKPFIAEVQLTADREYGAIRLRSALDIRLENVQLDVSYRIAPGAKDLIAEAVVTNRGTAPATMELSGFAAGYPRAKASVADLQAGESATRRFLFPGGVSRLRGQRIVVGAQDIETQARVNRSITVE